MNNILKNSLKYGLQVLSNRRFIYRYSNSNSIYLTFDDGPYLDFTPAILEILDFFRIKATFFLVGKNIEKNMDILRDIILRGHTIGHHTYSHKKIIDMTYKEFVLEIERMNKLLLHVIGIKSNLFRPPQGVFNLMNLIWARSLDLKFIHYTHSFNDWDAKSKEQILLQVRKASYYEGDIILFHDNNNISVKTLPNIIEKLQKNNFKFSAIK